jgi:glyoxylase-like metal-dependent hydrolase (beta-lactamase superfamily II)
MALTEAGDVSVVPVPGHSPGQLAVVVEDGDHAVFLAADSSYTEDALLRDVVDGVGPDEAAEHLTHERIRAYAAETPTVYLPTHDPETGARLAARQTLGAAPERVIA